MTHVDWHPVTVNDSGEIIEGDIPEETGKKWVTINDGTGITFSTLGVFDEIDGINSRVQFFRPCRPYEITAWAYLEYPEPYQPEVEHE